MSKKEKAKYNLSKHYRTTFYSEVKNKKLFLTCVKSMSDNTSVSQTELIDSKMISDLRKCKTRNEFSTLLSKKYNYASLFKVDSQAKKQQFTKNTAYCTLRDALIRVMNLKLRVVATRKKQVKKRKTVKKVKS